MRFWGQKESRPLITSAAPQAWSRLSLSRLQSSFFSEGQLDKANSLSRIPWLKWYWSPMLHVKIDIYERVWSLTPQEFFSFWRGGCPLNCLSNFHQRYSQTFFFSPTLLPRHTILWIRSPWLTNCTTMDNTMASRRVNRKELHMNIHHCIIITPIVLSHIILDLPKLRVTNCFCQTSN